VLAVEFRLPRWPDARPASKLALFGWPVAKACGGYYSLAIGASGTLYAWGCGVFCDGGNDGVIPALGRPDTSSETIHPTAVDGVGPVAAVAAGAYDSVALTKDGRVLTFGAAQLGQLGRSPDGGGGDKAGLPVDARPRPAGSSAAGSSGEDSSAAGSSTGGSSEGGSSEGASSAPALQSFWVTHS
jgi:hypothetical protein